MALDFPRRHATRMEAAHHPGRDRTDPAPTPQAADKFQHAAATSRCTRP
jgi:hypothetical protein